MTCVLAFNDSQFPALPWKGFTLEWFTGSGPERVGIFYDRMNLDSIWVSLRVAFLMSFENFNTTLFLVGSETTLPINLYLQVRDGSTPVINAISFLLIVGTSLLAMVNLYFGKKET